jgi:hypothetical protein
MVMEHGEKLAAMVKLNELQTSFSRHTLITQITPSLPTTPCSLSAVWDCILLAGSAMRNSNIAFSEYSYSTLFFSRPSSSLSLFFSSISQHAKTIVFRNESIHGDDMALSESVRRLIQLVETSEKVFQSVGKFKEMYARFYPEFLVDEPWSIRPAIRKALWRICSISIQFWFVPYLIYAVSFSILIPFSFSSLPLLSFLLLPLPFSAPLPSSSSSLSSPSFSSVLPPFLPSSLNICFSLRPYSHLHVLALHLLPTSSFNPGTICTSTIDRYPSECWRD